MTMTVTRWSNIRKCGNRWMLLQVGQHGSVQVRLLTPFEALRARAALKTLKVFERASQFVRRRGGLWV